MRNIFTFWFIVIILILIISGCNERNISSLTSIENNDIIELDIDNNLNLEEDIIEEEEVLEPLVPDPCIECKMYFVLRLMQFGKKKFVLINAKIHQLYCQKLNALNILNVIQVNI